MDNGYIDNDDGIPLLDFYIENMMFTNFNTKKKKLSRLELEEKIASIILECCKNKRLSTLPRKWGFDCWKQRVEFVYWSGYSKNKAVIKLYDTLVDEFF